MGKIQIFAGRLANKTPVVWAPIRERPGPGADFIVLEGELSEKAFEILERNWGPEAFFGTERGTFSLRRPSLKAIEQEVRNRMMMGYRYFGDFGDPETRIELLDRSGQSLSFSMERFSQGHTKAIFTLARIRAKISREAYQAPVWS